MGGVPCSTRGLVPSTGNSAFTPGDYKIGRIYLSLEMIKTVTSRSNMRNMRNTFGIIAHKTRTDFVIH